MKLISNIPDLGVAIRGERKLQELTQEQLAAMAGVGVRFVRELEHGKQSCQIGKALLVLQTLGLSLQLTTRRI